MQPPKNISTMRDSNGNDIPVKYVSKYDKARELMLGYVDGVLERVGGYDAQALRLIVAEAFRANAQGFLSTGKVLALLRMEIDNDDWREAKRILQESIKPQKGKRYLYCERRPTTQVDFAPIRLDIADCWPEDGGAL